MALSSIPNANGAACYFCLGEEGDDEGNSLVRDCSCRGNSGFAHLSCLSKYAEQKCRAARDGDMKAFTEPWEECNNCKQPFQGQLAIDLASAFVSFAETTYGHPAGSKWDKLKVIAALCFKLESLNKLPNANAVEVTMSELKEKILSMINQTKKDFKMNSWVHMPKGSVEYHYYKLLCGHYEAYTYRQSGRKYLQSSSEENFNAMMTHYKKARAIYNLFGMEGDVQHMDILISLVTAKKQATNDGMSSFTTAVPQSTVHTFGEIYERSIHTNGMDSEDTLQLGLNYANVLQKVNRIEAERIITNLSTISRRVHGPEHRITTEAVKVLELCKERYVIVLPDDKVFEALRYENDGEICVVQGPITEPRNIADERMYHVANKLVIPIVGCPVICHGLVSASHLNGMLGEVRHFKQDGTGLRLGVYFEKKGVKSALVKPENLRIAFHLPSED
jgi:hypothetical protein